MTSVRCFVPGSAVLGLHVVDDSFCSRSPGRAHWNLTAVKHTRGVRDRPQEDERRVTDFFDTALTTQQEDIP